MRCLLRKAYVAAAVQDGKFVQELRTANDLAQIATADLNFVQISDSHIGFKVNVANIQEGGLGTLGQEQLDWLEKDIKSLSTSTPIVLFAHIPLWAVYPQWGWGTDDAERALSLVKRFGSVTVLNGHIHQVMQKVEGNVTFHTARGTAFPLPTPGSVPKPIPMVVEATQLKKMLGLTSVNYTETNHTLAVVDSTLE
jgi:3',5'-cyclic-AMP phosphodiesterase